MCFLDTKTRHQDKAYTSMNHLQLNMNLPRKPCMSRFLSRTCNFRRYTP